MPAVILMCSAWMIGVEVVDGLGAGHAEAYSSRAGREIGVEGRDQLVRIAVGMY